MIPLAWLLLARAPAVEAVPQAPPSKTAAVEARPAGKLSADHDRLDALAGRFRFERTTEPAATGRPAEKGTGWTENRWILDNHYLECRMSEGETGSNETAVVTYGYDMRRRTYFALAVGSRGTNYRNLEGFWDELAHSLVLLGKDPGDGKTPGPKFRQVLRVENRDRHVVELYVIYPGRLPQKASELVFTRQ
jgi:hypothetical protein